MCIHIYIYNIYHTYTLSYSLHFPTNPPQKVKLILQPSSEKRLSLDASKLLSLVELVVGAIVALHFEGLGFRVFLGGGFRAKGLGSRVTCLAFRKWAVPQKPDL